MFILFYRNQLVFLKAQTNKRVPYRSKRIREAIAIVYHSPEGYKLMLINNLDDHDHDDDDNDDDDHLCRVYTRHIYVR